jgi:hypothetical protein
MKKCADFRQVSAFSPLVRPIDSGGPPDVCLSSPVARFGPGKRQIIGGSHFMQAAGCALKLKRTVPGGIEPIRLFFG